MQLQILRDLVQEVRGLRQDLQEALGTISSYMHACVHGSTIGEVPSPAVDVSATESGEEGTPFFACKCLLIYRFRFMSEGHPHENHSRVDDRTNLNEESNHSD